jgi:hypothetical protein
LFFACKQTWNMSRFLCFGCGVIVLRIDVVT